MLRNTLALTLLSASLLSAANASAADKLIVSTWGGSFKDLIDKAIGQEFTKQTGVEVEYVTGGTIDRLNKAKLAGTAETDLTFTTSHVGWLYTNDGLFEDLDMSKIPNASNLVHQAQLSPNHIGVWGYVYTIGYRPELVPEGETFESWEDLWKPEMKGSLALPDWDPSHIIAVSAKLAGSDAEHWEAGQDKLKSLIPNIKAFYTNDANSQQLIATGETPVQVLLSMNAYHMMEEGVDIKLAMPKEGAVLGIDAMGINKGTEHADLAYKFMDIALSPEVQAKIAEINRGSPVVTNATVDPEIAKLPGMLTTAEQWDATLDTDPKLRAEKTSEWRKWFSENIMAN
ncbi:polyamine ABC transporter substrate-binding protein [Marinobacterium lutimaris]|uniref:Putative spermidine/putrescine transport system substrate-binding protein n=1 Tax=Marinobacterium lutimaris TaxID=568106 RepID=A0A1H6DKD8_9GAMM|nr:polyamine ABC transporter substrate-binding protein [Marinobacterium lutimaris]SEG85581.1 putative spermidine/putrescine transport system substrate-binding protein [Marinobacterium lutimaris]